MSDYGPYAVHPLADLFPLIEGADFEEFVGTIREFGQEEPIMLSADGTTLLDGRNRFRACLTLGIEPIVATAPADWTPERVIAYIVTRNLTGRRHLATGQRALLGVQVEAAYASAARERQEQSGRDYGRGKVPVKTPEPIGPESKRENESREKAARAVGVGSQAITQAKALVADAPDLAAEVRAGTKKLGTAHREMKERQAGVIPIDDRARKSEAERVAEIAPRAARGESSHQIATALGLGRERVVEIAKRNGIAIHADALVGRTHRIDSMRVARTTAEQIIACSAGLSLINFDDLDPAEAADWVTPMRKSLQELKRFADQVAACCEQNKEMTQ